MGKGFHYPTVFCVNYLFLSLCNYSSQFTSCNWCFLYPFPQMRPQLFHFHSQNTNNVCSLCKQFYQRFMNSEIYLQHSANREQFQNKNESESHSVMSNSLQFHALHSSVHGIPYCTVHGILQAKTVEWVPFSMGSSQPRNQTQVSLIAGGFFTS